ncbi:MAG: hypothetical protein E7434_09240 [Ruminococcaceae bacterium]|nr:hypothetical protein [Oscillospiraceae bacterium]
MKTKKLTAMLLCMAILLSMFPLPQVSANSETDIAYAVEGGKFAPNASCTIGQIVTFLYRAIA